MTKLQRIARLFTVPPPSVPASVDASVPDQYEAHPCGSGGTVRGFHKGNDCAKLRSGTKGGKIATVLSAAKSKAAAKRQQAAKDKPRPSTGVGSGTTAAPRKIALKRGSREQHAVHRAAIEATGKALDERHRAETAFVHTGDPANRDALYRQAGRAYAEAQDALKADRRSKGVSVEELRSLSRAAKESKAVDGAAALEGHPTPLGSLSPPPKAATGGEGVASTVSKIVTSAHNNLRDLARHADIMSPASLARGVQKIAGPLSAAEVGELHAAVFGGDKGKGTKGQRVRAIIEHMGQHKGLPGGGATETRAEAAQPEQGTKPVASDRPQRSLDDFRNGVNGMAEPLDPEKMPPAMKAAWYRGQDARKRGDSEGSRRAAKAWDAEVKKYLAGEDEKPATPAAPAPKEPEPALTPRTPPANPHGRDIKDFVGADGKLDPAKMPPAMADAYRSLEALGGKGSPIDRQYRSRQFKKELNKYLEGKGKAPKATQPEQAKAAPASPASSVAPPSAGSPSPSSPSALPKPKVEYVHAPKGGATSDVNGQFYKGGRLMPIHGLFVGQERGPKGTGTVVASPSAPNPESEGRGRLPRTPAKPLTPEQIEERRQGAERQKQWSAVRSGPLGQMISMGERPHEIKRGPGLTPWSKWAESATPEQVKAVGDAAREIYIKNSVDKESKRYPNESREDLARQIGENFDMYLSDNDKYLPKSHQKKVPGSGAASVAMNFAIPEASMSDLQRLNEIMAGGAAPQQSPSSSAGSPQPTLREQAASHREKQYGGIGGEVRKSTAEIIRDNRQGKPVYGVSVRGPGGIGSRPKREELGQSIADETRAKTSGVVSKARARIRDRGTFGDESQGNGFQLSGSPANHPVTQADSLIRSERWTPAQADRAEKMLSSAYVPDSIKSQLRDMVRSYRGIERSPALPTPQPKVASRRPSADIEISPRPSRSPRPPRSPRTSPAKPIAAAAAPTAGAPAPAPTAGAGAGAAGDASAAAAVKPVGEGSRKYATVAPVTSGSFNDRLQHAFSHLDREGKYRGGNMATLSGLRSAFPELSADQFKHELDNLRRSGHVSVSSHEGLYGALTPEERAAGIQEHGSNLVYASIDPERPLSSATATATPVRSATSTPATPTTPTTAATVAPVAPRSRPTPPPRNTRLNKITGRLRTRISKLDAAARNDPAYLKAAQEFTSARRHGTAEGDQRAEEAAARATAAKAPYQRRIAALQSREEKLSRILTGVTPEQERRAVERETGRGGATYDARRGGYYTGD